MRVCVSATQPSSAMAAPMASTRSGRAAASRTAQRARLSTRRARAAPLRRPGATAPMMSPAPWRAGPTARVAAAGLAADRPGRPPPCASTSAAARRNVQASGDARRRARARGRSRGPSGPGRAAGRGSRPRWPARRWRSSAPPRGARSRGSTSRPLLVDARLELDPVVDGEADQDGQHGDRWPSSARPRRAHRAEDDAAGAEREAERQQPQAGACGTRAAASAITTSGAASSSAIESADARGEVAGDDGHAGDRVGPPALELEVGELHGSPRGPGRSLACAPASERPGLRRTWTSAAFSAGKR